MAEEPKKKHITSALLLHRNCLILVCCSLLLSFSQLTAEQLAFSYQSDLSMPLWGGGQALLQMSSADSKLTGEQTLHHFDHIPCEICHQATAAGLPESARDNSWKNVDVNRSCTLAGCHEYDEKLNHPLNKPLQPNMSDISSGRSPLLTCLSCHRTTKPEGNHLSNETALFLKAPQSIGCESCHQKLSGSLRRQSHWKFAPKAHLVSLLPGRSYKQDLEFTGSQIDEESLACLSCHDEVNVTIPAFNETSGLKSLRFQGMTDHPIGMDYQSILSQNPAYFKSLSGQSSLRMFDGKIGCGTCHSVYSDSRSNLVAQYEGSVLCRSCHNR